MTKYTITMNSISGQYDAESADAALDAFAQDAGYTDWTDAVSQGLASNDDVTVESDE